MTQKESIGNRSPQQYSSTTDEFDEIALEDRENYLFLRDVFAGK